MYNFFLSPICFFFLKTSGTKQEYQRWARAYKRIEAKEHIDKSSFYEDVFLKAIPEAVTDRIFEVFTNNAPGMNFTDLFCGLVLLLKVIILFSSLY